MRRTVFIAALLGLSACFTAPEPAPPPPAAPAPQPPPASTPPPAADSCNAGSHRHLVGRPRSEIPVPVKPERQRAACVGCPITMDYDPERLNFFFDEKTGIIREVRCG